MAHELTGKVKLVLDPQTFGSGFTKREMVVVVEDGRYPQEIIFEFLQDRIDMLDGLVAGQEVTVTFDVRGREYNGRYFNNIVGWKVSAMPIASTEATGDEQAPPDKPPADSDEYEDDVPF